MCKKVIIVGSGPSAKDFTPPDDCVVIAVNGAETRLPKFQYYFTLDPDVNCNDNVIRKTQTGETVVAYNKRLYGVDIFFERVADIVTGIQGFTGTLAGKRGLSEDKTKINTGNSVYGALGFAYHLGFDKLVFVGLDAGGDAHLDYDAPRMDLNIEYCHLNELFESAMPQVTGRVVNACPNSNVTCMPRMTIGDAMVWLNE